jgi:hypothetical protein
MTGIADDSVIHSYVEQLAGTAVSCESAEDRAAQVMQEVNNLLGQEHVPPVHRDWGSSGDGNYGAFAPWTWTMSLNQSYFDESAGSDANTLEHNYREALQTVFHEARHAEQSFRCLREVIGLGATPEQAVYAMHQAAGYAPPIEVAQAAAQVPLTQCDVAQNEAAQWYESVYGSGAAHHNATESDPQADYNAYRSLPDEADAWSADDRVGQEYDRQMHPQQ